MTIVRVVTDVIRLSADMVISTTVTGVLIADKSLLDRKKKNEKLAVSRFGVECRQDISVFFSYRALFFPRANRNPLVGVRLRLLFLEILEHSLDVLSQVDLLFGQFSDHVGVHSDDGPDHVDSFLLCVGNCVSLQSVDEFIA